MEDLSTILEQRLGQRDAIRHLARLGGYREVPPTFDEFITDDYFAGSDDCVGNTLWPVWRDALRQIYPHPLYSDYMEVCLTGAIGIGKSTCCLVGMLYDLCRLLYLKNPHRTFQLMKATPLVVAFLNANLGLAQTVLVDQFKTMIETSPFFEEQQKMARKLDRKSFLPNKISIMGGSRSSHAYGKGIVMAILSELNFQGAVKDQAMQNYVHTSRRIKSRFGRGDGFTAPGRLWLDSSRKDETGFLETYVAQMSGREDVFKLALSIWEAQKSSGKFVFSGEEFKVYIGDDKFQPEILDKPGKALGRPVELIINVPEEYRPEFESDIFGALRDFAGVSVWSGHRFYSNEGLLRAQCSLPNPVRRDLIELDADNPDDQLINYLYTDRDRVENPEMAKILSKTIPMYIHFDLAKGKEGGDVAGIAATCCMGEVTVERRERGSLISQVKRDNMYHTVFALAVKARNGQELSLSRFRHFIGDLVELGYLIGGVSADGWQSEDLLGSCRDVGITSKLISVDRPRDHYDHHKNCLLERRWSGPASERMILEFLALRDKGVMIDHPEDTGMSKVKPSKDVSDCVVGSVAHCKELSMGTSAVSAMTQFAERLETAQEAAKAKDLRSTLKRDILKKNNLNRRR